MIKFIKAGGPGLDEEETHQDQQRQARSINSETWMGDYKQGRIYIWSIS